MRRAVLYVDSREAALKESGDVLLSGVSLSWRWCPIGLAWVPGFHELPLPDLAVTPTSLWGDSS